MNIPLAKPFLGKLEREFVVGTIDDGQISGFGHQISQAESAIAGLSQRNHCALVSNGTVALHLALLSLNIGKGDEVIVPSFGYVAFANAVLYVGATPVFVDIEPNSWGIDPNLVEKAISKRTKALIVVHNYGIPSKMDEIEKLCMRYNIPIIEDAAEALGTKFQDKSVGSFGIISTYSFYGNKILTCGEGGAVLTNDKSIDSQIRLLRGQGMDPNRRYFFPVVGYNYRLSNLLAGLLNAQIQQLQEFLIKRREIFELYDEVISPKLSSPFKNRLDYAPWIYTTLVPESKWRDPIIKHLASQGIETRPAFSPLSSLPAYTKYAARKEFPITNDISSRGLSLPTFFELTKNEVILIATTINEYIK